MKVSQRVTYGIMAAVDLALNDKRDSPVQARVIAKHQGIPIRFLEQVLHSMKRAGLVESLRGAQGGYRLNRSPVALSVAEIMEALDGPLSRPTPSRQVGEKPLNRSELLLGYIWEQVQRAERHVLENITIEQLAVRQQAIDEQRNHMYHI